MVKVVAVTTFNSAGLDLYGRQMMASFSRNWPREIPLRVYYEDWDPPAEARATSRNLHFFDLLNQSPWLEAFKARHANRTDTDDFRKAAVRFSHKVAALCHTVDRSGADFVIWIDADIIAHSPITAEEVAGLLPAPDEWIAWLDRGPRIYPECGFYIINNRHHFADRLIGEFEDMYAQDRLFALPEWHDSYVLWEVVKRSAVRWRSLSQGAVHTHHPLINGPLGKWFDHLKGKRKVFGRSLKSDLKLPRTEAYWGNKI